MTDFGMKVSKEGFDVGTAAIKDLVLHSEHFGIKIGKVGSTTFSVTSGSGGSTTVAHGMGYTPGFLAFIKFGGTKYFPPSSWNIDSNYEQFLASSDGTNLNFSVDSNANTSYTATVYYFILVDPAQPTVPASGVASTGSYGIKISKPGVDVKAAKDTELVFSSKFNTFKVAGTGTGSLTSDITNPQTATIAHGMGYVPAFMVFTEIHAGFGEPSTGDFYMSPHSPPASIGGSLVDETIICSIDSTNLHILMGKVVVNTGRVINYKYVFFHNQIE